MKASRERVKLGKLRKLLTVASAAGELALLISRIIALAVTVEIKIRLRLWRYSTAFSRAVRRGKLPEDLAAYLI
ncbi:MAG: hypothetical protein J7L12_03770, partial [Desulfurococcales archaeon]|nr:hypothetical protein [Desulfurococcales archaeon]